MKEHGKAATESQADEHEAVDLGLFSCCVQVFPGQDLKDVPEEEGEGGGDCGHADGGDRSHRDERPLLGVDLEHAPQAGLINDDDDDGRNIYLRNEYL